jgi:hypothetical protein
LSSRYAERAASTQPADRQAPQHERSLGTSIPAPGSVAPPTRRDFELQLSWLDVFQCAVEAEWPGRLTFICNGVIATSRRIAFAVFICVGGFFVEHLNRAVNDAFG